MPHFLYGKFMQNYAIYSSAFRCLRGFFSFFPPLLVSLYVKKYPANSAANMYGAITLPVNMTYSVNAPPTIITVSMSSTTVTGRISVRRLSNVAPIYNIRPKTPSPRQNKNA